MPYHPALIEEPDERPSFLAVADFNLAEFRDPSPKVRVAYRHRRLNFLVHIRTRLYDTETEHSTSNDPLGNVALPREANPQVEPGMKTQRHCQHPPRPKSHSDPGPKLAWKTGKNESAGGLQQPAVMRRSRLGAVDGPACGYWALWLECSGRTYDLFWIMRKMR